MSVVCVVPPSRTTRERVTGRLASISPSGGVAASRARTFVEVTLPLLRPALLVACLVFLVTIIALNRRMGEIERQGIQVSSLILSREERVVLINNLEFKLTGLQPVPWTEHTSAQVLMDMLHQDGQPFPANPRHILRSIAARDIIIGFSLNPSDIP